jgi:hypothetical protein
MALNLSEGTATLILPSLCFLYRAAQVRAPAAIALLCALYEFSKMGCYLHHKPSSLSTGKQTWPQPITIVQSHSIEE